MKIQNIYIHVNGHLILNTKETVSIKKNGFPVRGLNQLDMKYMQTIFFAREKVRAWKNIFKVLLGFKNLQFLLLPEYF